jgi:hypothetical protein
MTDDPLAMEPEVSLEEETLSRFLLQYTLFQAMNDARYHAWTYVMPTPQLDPLWSMLRPVPLSPFLPTFTGERFFMAPGLLAMISLDEAEAVACFGAHLRGVLTPLLGQDLRWAHFDG